MFEIRRLPMWIDDSFTAGRVRTGEAFCIYCMRMHTHGCLREWHIAEITHRVPHCGRNLIRPMWETEDLCGYLPVIVGTLADKSFKDFLKIPRWTETQLHNVYDVGKIDLVMRAKMDKVEHLAKITGVYKILEASS